jgi:hypothetical protein
MDLDRVRVVRVVRVAAQLQPGAGRYRIRSQRLRMMRVGAGHARDPQATRGQLGRVAGEVAARVAVDDLIASDPDLTTVVGVPVALVVLDVDPHG